MIAWINCLIKNDKINRAITLFCFIYMMFLSGMRSYTVGTDTFRYAELFRGVRSTDKVLEFIFLWLISACRELFSSYTSLLLLLSLLFYIPCYYVASREVKRSFKYFLLLFLISNNLYFIDSFNAIRQLVSSAFLLVSYMYLQKKDKLAFIVFFVIAFGFHNSALFFLPFILLSKIKIGVGAAYIILILSVFFSLAGSFFLSRYFLFDLLSSITLLEIGRYSHYLINSDYSMGFNIVGMTKIVIIPAIVCGVCYKYLSNSIYSRLYLWAIVFLSVLSPFIAISSRASMGLSVAELVLVPQAISLSKKYSLPHIILLGYLFLYSLLMVYSLIVEYSSPEELGDYSTFFMD